VLTTVVVVGGGRPGGNGMDSLAIEYAEMEREEGGGERERDRERDSSPEVNRFFGTGQADGYGWRTSPMSAQK